MKDLGQILNGCNIPGTAREGRLFVAREGEAWPEGTKSLLSFRRHPPIAAPGLRACWLPYPPGPSCYFRSDDEVTGWFKSLADILAGGSLLYPAMMYCLQGRDRTGLAALFVGFLLELKPDRAPAVLESLDNGREQSAQDWSIRTADRHALMIPADQIHRIRQALLIGEAS